LWDPCVPDHWAPSRFGLCWMGYQTCNRGQTSFDSVYCCLNPCCAFWNSCCVSIATMHQRPLKCRPPTACTGQSNWCMENFLHFCVRVKMCCKIDRSWRRSRVPGLVPKKYVMFRKTTWMLRTQRLMEMFKNTVPESWCSNAIRQVQHQRHRVHRIHEVVSQLDVSVFLGWNRYCETKTKSLLWIEKARDKEKTYERGSVQWETKH